MLLEMNQAQYDHQTGAAKTEGKSSSVGVFRSWLLSQFDSIVFFFFNHSLEKVKQKHSTVHMVDVSLTRCLNIR